jgi:hypothetical protein
MRYTKCASLSDYDDHWPANWNQGPVLPVLLNALKQGAVFGALGALIGAVLFGAVAGAAALGAALLGLIFFNYAFVDGFCDQWLNWRLICVQRDTCAMGRVAWIETVDKKFENDLIPFEYLFDNDLSFNLRLMPFNGRSGGKFEFDKDDGATKFGIDQILAKAGGYPSSQLLKAGKDLGKNYAGYDGEGDHAKPDHPGGRWTMHCEIEGDGMQVLCTIAKVFAVLGPFGQGLGAVAGGLIVGGSLAKKVYDAVHDGCKKACKVPILCDIACFVVAAAAAAVTFVAGFIAGAIIGALPGIGPLAIGALLGLVARHDGRWTDVANDPESGSIEEGDCVIVSGDEVYDAGHSDGWAEIHPVIHLQKMCALEDKEHPEKDCCEGTLTTDPKFGTDKHVDFIKRLWDNWCRAVQAGYKPEVIREQRQALHSWSIHPLIDGCLPGRVRDEGGFRPPA